MTVRRSFHRRVVTAAALALSLLALAASAAPASALTARFAVNDGDEYTRWLRVSAGDGGWSPFFTPAVVVWDGGSIVAGHGAAVGYEFPVQTLALVPKPCRTYVSTRGGARIADMIAEAPFDLDPRYRTDADLNVCLVQAGGGDFRAGASAAEVYSAVRSYSRARRAAGFRVVVLTILPSSDPVTFEATRLAYDSMVRGTWDEFADGVADIAGDDRIGETGDNLDLQFYGTDALHPNSAGCAVMATITAPVLRSLPWTSDDCEVRLRDAAGEWRDWRPYTASTTMWLTDVQGPHTVEAQYRTDGGEPVLISDSIFVDTLRPVPVALRDVRVRRGRRAALRYRVDDAAPCGPFATVVLTVTKPGGKVLKTWTRRMVPVGVSSALTFTCRLPKGSYRFVVAARDTAGNRHLTPGSARLTVR
jgi:hypothetical protein